MSGSRNGGGWGGNVTTIGHVTTGCTVVTVDGEARGEGKGSGERGYVTSRGHVAWPLSESRVGPSGSCWYRSKSNGWRHRRGWRGRVAAGAGVRCEGRPSRSGAAAGGSVKWDAMMESKRVGDDGVPLASSRHGWFQSEGVSHVTRKELQQSHVTCRHTELQTILPALI